MIVGNTNDLSKNDILDGEDELDMHRILEYLGGDTSLLSTLGKIYQEDYPALLAEMEVAVNASNAGLLRESTHKLRGLVANFHDVELSETLSTLESNASVGDLSKTPQLLIAIKMRCDWLSSSLRKFVRAD